MVHDHAASRGQGRGLGRALAVPVLVMALEVAGGIAGHSMALLSDAGHQATDVLAAALALAAERKGGSGPTRRQSYGFQRIGILVGALNGLLLLVVAAVVVMGAVPRLFHPGQVAPAVMVAVAGAGILLQVWVASGLGRTKGDLNRRALLTHVLTDIAGSVAILIGAGVIALTGFTLLDPLLSLAIAGLIVVGSYRILRVAVGILMESVPAHVDPEAVSATLLDDAQVKGLHDLHIWSLGEDRVLLTCHIFVDEMTVGESQALIERLSRRLERAFGIQHATFQMESRDTCLLSDV